MQFNGSAQSMRSEAECVSLGSTPCSPFNDNDETVRKQLLGQIPLESLDLRPLALVVHVDCKSLHPIVGREAYRTVRLFKQMGMSGFAGSGQAAHNDESRGRTGLIHNRLLLAALSSRTVFGLMAGSYLVNLI